jgi:hypothetical protein
MNIVKDDSHTQFVIFSHTGHPCVAHAVPLGKGEGNFRVRYGNGCFLYAITTGN